MAIQNTPPLSATYLNVQIAKISAALPALGAWDTPTILACPYFEGVNLAFTYTRAAAGGAFDWQIEVSLYSTATVPAGASEWITESVYASGAVVAGVDTQSRVQREYQTYTSQGVAAEDFVYTMHFPIPIERIRVRARESGAVAPGTLQIQAVFA